MLVAVRSERARTKEATISNSRKKSDTPQNVSEITFCAHYIWIELILNSKNCHELKSKFGKMTQIRGDF